MTKIPDGKIIKFTPANDRGIVHEPAINLPPVVKALGLLLFAITLLQHLVPEDMNDGLIWRFGFIPARYSGDLPFDLAAALSPVTYMFLHGGWLHLLANLGMLLAFGAGLEQAVGGKKLLALYFISGIASVFVQFLLFPHGETPLVGASGGISGLFGGIMMMMYRRGDFGAGYRKLLPFIIVWVLVSVFFGMFGMPGANGNIAWIVHIAGFFAGLLIYAPLAAFRRGGT